LRPLELYEFEGCPFCRKAREAISVLDLTTEVRPCPKQGERFRPRAIELGGKASFPTLVDPNQPEGAQVMQESDRIVEALFARYGRSEVPSLLRAGGAGNALSGLSTAMRAGRGTLLRARKPGHDPRLVLYAHEGQADARPIKELLSELELPYLWHPDAEGSANASRDSPRLIDETANTTLLGSDAVTRHLRAKYAA
jgi:glutathione S-transferase